MVVGTEAGTKARKGNYVVEARDNLLFPSESVLSTTKTISPTHAGSPEFFKFLWSSPPGATMSRRESRVSMNVRQNDALFEFENCMFRFYLCLTISPPDMRWHSVKKKFLLANKHITKYVSFLYLYKRYAT
jgi:hypothetical protein